MPYFTVTVTIKILHVLLDIQLWILRCCNFSARFESVNSLPNIQQTWGPVQFPVYLFFPFNTSREPIVEWDNKVWIVRVHDQNLPSNIRAYIIVAMIILYNCNLLQSASQLQCCLSHTIAIPTLSYQQIWTDRRVFSRHQKSPPHHPRPRLCRIWPCEIVSTGDLSDLIMLATTYVILHLNSNEVLVRFDPEKCLEVLW